jgi:hypothetical protein
VRKPNGSSFQHFPYSYPLNEHQSTILVANSLIQVDLPPMPLAMMFQITLQPLSTISQRHVARRVAKAATSTTAVSTWNT